MLSAGEYVATTTDLPPFSNFATPNCAVSFHKIRVKASEIIKSFIDTNILIVFYEKRIKILEYNFPREVILSKIPKSLPIKTAHKYIGSTDILSILILKYKN